MGASSLSAVTGCPMETPDTPTDELSKLLVSAPPATTAKYLLDDDERDIFAQLPSAPAPPPLWCVFDTE